MNVIRISCCLIFTISLLSAQSCLPTGIEFLNQASIDAFASDYPDCTVIEGSVQVAGDDIVTLAGLSQLIEIRGGLVVQDCPLLDDLQGLENVTVIGGDVFITKSALTNVDAIANIESVERLTVRSCSSLEYIIGFNNLQDVSAVIVDRCAVLQSITGFEELQSVSDSLAFNFLPALTELSTFSGLEQVGTLYIRRLQAIRKVVGFENLVTATRLDFSTNGLISILGFDSLIESGSILFFSSEIDSLAGFNDLQEVYGGLAISNLTQSNSIDAFKSIKRIGTNLLFSGCSSSDFKGFQNLEVIGFTQIIVCDFENLDFLASVTSLTSIIGEIAITFCPNLIDISGLDNIDDSSVKRIIIGGNDSLSICHSDLVCAVIERLGPDDPNIILFDNGPGCSTAEEILEQCALKDDDDPMADLCPMMARPGMQIERIAADNYRVLYSYGAERMYMEDIDINRLIEMIVHFKMEKDVFFDFDRFNLSALCQQAEALARGEAYQYNGELTVGREHFVDQVMSEASYYITFCQFINGGECVKL